jgi:hypothetical protein
MSWSWSDPSIRGTIFRNDLRDGKLRIWLDHGHRYRLRVARGGAACEPDWREMAEAGSAS